MINKIKDNLSIKIFLITSLLLITVCILTYIFIAGWVPTTISDNIRTELAIHSHNLTRELRKVNIQDMNTTINEYVQFGNFQVMILNSYGVEVYSSLPSEIIVTDDTKFADKYYEDYNPNPIEKFFGNFFSHDTSITIGDNFRFKDSNKIYDLIVMADARTVNQVSRAFENIWPILLFAILIISMLSAKFYSRYITKPIVKLSEASEKISNLDFSDALIVNRTDEIGVLTKNINEISTRLSTALDELQNDVDRERELNERQSEFFASASHELKTPITILKGQIVGMIENVGIYHDRDEFLPRSLGTVEQMERLVQELLTVSKIENTNIELNLENINLSQLIDDCIEDYKYLFEEKNQIIGYNCEDEIYIEGDVSLIPIVVYNLLSNASFYSPEDANISLRLSSSDKIVFQIENSGTSIPEEFLENIFEPFYRLEKSRNRETGGTGIGLYLVKAILDRHNANCVVENTLSGVKFTITF